MRDARTSMRALFRLSMTTITSMVPIAAMLAALAVVACAVRFVLRRAASAPHGGDETIDVPMPRGDAGEYGVPFTYLGVEVEPPSAPAWPTRRSNAANEPKPAPARAHAPLALAHVDRATAILHDHVRQQSASIASWLMLLELYRTHGREQALADLARDFSDRFHRPGSDGADAVRGGAGSGLEAFPAVMRLVTMLWGTDECRDLLDRLERDRGDGRRFCLSRAAYIDIAALATLHNTLLAEIDADLAEEAKVRAAWQRASYVAQVPI
jgi:hypothetical protein